MSDIEIFPDTSEYPDHVFFGTDATNMESPDGWDGRYGVIQPGFEQRFPTPETGERIWLHEPTGNQELEISVLDENGAIESTHYLKSGGVMVHVAGGRDILVATPEGQGDIGYMCDYPGVRPQHIPNAVTRADFERLWEGSHIGASWSALGRFVKFSDFPLREAVADDGSVAYEGDIAAAVQWIRRNRDGVSRFILEKMLQEAGVQN